MKYLLCCLMLMLFSACNFTEIEREEKRVLLVVGPEALQLPGNADIVEKLAAVASTEQIRLDTSFTFELLEEDTLQTYSTLVLLDIIEDSLRVWHHADIERYVEMGGGVIIADTNRVTPYLWPWFSGLKSGDYQAAVAYTPEDDPLADVSKYKLGSGRVAVPQSSGLDEEKVSALLSFSIDNNRYDPAKAVSPRAANFNRYTKIVLDDNIYEPMDLVVLPDLRVLFLERRGKMKMYDPALEETRQVANFDVCIDGNYEDGLTGLALDPGYGKENHWIYVYYSPSAACDNPNQYLSRFVFKDDSLHRASEKVVLEVFVQRETCCHSGGAIKFGPDSLLYLSTGDNTSSKESDGFTPIDERPGRGPFDAQKSSSNTHDLRGKILRIKPEADGSYTIPDGNLFPKDGSQGRPEIYAMGCRNPFRIAIDPQTNWLYWGDVGPDGGHPGRYGPASLDEWNQAKGPGFFGWPYFVGDNAAYNERDFATDEVGAPFDPAHPVNDSPNNSGSRELPPAQPSWVWYDYGDSEEFPLLGAGSRSAMAGPFYSSSAVDPQSPVKFPEYYDGKFFAFEWARSWIQVWTIDKTTGELLKMEPLLPKMPLSKPIDVEFGPDGALYLLEYGRQYFMNNPDATLSRIGFARGNRPPVAQVHVDKANGAAPHSVRFSATGSYDFDVEDSLLTYEWHFTDTANVQATGESVEFTFTENGIYAAQLNVRDSHGAVTTLEETIQVGNAPPQVAIRLAGNSTFYTAKEKLNYNIEISDKEDLENGGIQANDAVVNFSWMADADYLEELLKGREELPDAPLEFIDGVRLIAGSDCASCHDVHKQNIGPSYEEIARYYQKQNVEELVPHLALKIIKGGNETWGGAMMAAHPQLSQSDAEKMTRYILSLNNESKRYPLNGTFQLGNHKTAESPGGYIISATYKDRGANGIEGLSGKDVKILRSPKVEAETYDDVYNGLENRFGENREKIQVNMRASSWLMFKKLDLAGMKRARIRLKHYLPASLALYRHGVDGELMGQLKISQSGANGEWREYDIPLNKKTKGIADIYLVLNAQVTNDFDVFNVDWIEFK